MAEHAITVSSTGCPCHVDISCVCGWAERIDTPTPARLWAAEQEHLRLIYQGTSLAPVFYPGTESVES